MTAPLPVFLAIGSNLGDSEGNVRRAIEALVVRFPGSQRASSLYRTEPVGCPPGSPSFVNAVVRIDGFMGAAPSPSEILVSLLELESTFGRRERSVPNEPRVLDLDLIAVGSLAGRFGDLELPHPRAHLRAFVLLPLAELTPDFVLPGQTESVSTLAQRLDTTGATRL